MAYINWDSTHELGHPLIDDDHKSMIDHINLLVDAVVATAPDRKARIDAAYAALRRVTVAHFNAEVGIMELAGYPGLAAHRRQHAELLDEFDRFADWFDAPDSASIKQLIGFIGEWFTYHFRIWDVPFVRWLNEQSET